MSRLHLAITAVLGLILGGVVAGVIPAGANHQFPDLATSSPFHEAVDNFANAGCATGFPDGNYRPTEPVNRQQVARMINACGGRVDFDSLGPFTFTPTTSGLPMTASITPGAQRGGGLVVGIATVEAFAVGTTGLPCAFQFQLNANTVPLVPSQPHVADTEATADPTENEAVTLLGVFTAPPGVRVDVRVGVQMLADPPCTAGRGASGDIVALYFPFLGDGSGGGEL
jgi:hypothetical protein